MGKQLVHKRINVDGVDIFYREAGDPARPSLLLLHGFPTSSLMFKNLMVELSDEFHLVAPDYPGFGFSDFPSQDDFEYSFANIAAYIDKFTDAIKLHSFTPYLHDYGSYMGMRLCLKSPEKIKAVIVQNGNNYDEGQGPSWKDTKDYWEHPTEEKKKKVYAFLSEEGTREQYYAGVPEHLQQNISPESWIIDWERISRPGNLEMQFTLNCTLPTNFVLFPDFQKLLREKQPQALVIWGKNDVYFDVAEAYCYKKDLPDVQTYILEGGHMPLETNFEEVSTLVRHFMRSL